jgi:beta-glucosidase
VVVVCRIQTCLSDISRASFPKGFVFGTASSAFQVGPVPLLCFCFFF